MGNSHYAKYFLFLNLQTVHEQVISCQFLISFCIEDTAG